MPDFSPMMQASFSLILITLFVSVGFSILVLLILRPFFCWYFKINERTALLTEIRDLVAEQKVSEKSEPRYSSLSGGNPRNTDSQFDTKNQNQNDLTPNSTAEPEIVPQEILGTAENQTNCNIAKPLPMPSDKRWQPPGTKKQDG